MMTEGRAAVRSRLLSLGQYRGPRLRRGAGLAPVAAGRPERSCSLLLPNRQHQSHHTEAHASAEQAPPEGWRLHLAQDEAEVEHEGAEHQQRAGERQDLEWDRKSDRLSALSLAQEQEPADHEQD